MIQIQMVSIMILICELEDRGLDSQITFAEIFNEADGLRFINGYGN